MPEVVVHRGRQQVVLAPDGFFVGHECDYGAFRGLRLSLTVGGQTFQTDFV
jgi:hypothetical protein